MLFSKNKDNLFNVQLIGSKILKTKSTNVEKIDNELKEIILKMIATNKKFDGLGIAAPQIGINKRFFILDVPELERKEEDGPLSQAESVLIPQMPFAFINPEILEASKELRIKEEGCLSVPDIFTNVERPATILFKAETINGETITLEAGGLLARAFQHELDHLNGILFVNQAKPVDFVKIKKKLTSVKRDAKRKNFVRKK